jgi:hypothetical protein
MALHNWDGVTVLDLGEMDIWDGADLSLLRETLVRLIETEGRPAVGVNMTHVKYIPSGFFGMLFDWHEGGTSIFLYRPQPNVANMLWFRQFFEPVGDGCYQLLGEPKYELAIEGTQEWDATETWTENKNRRSPAAAHRE